MIKPWGIKERAVFLALAPAIVIAVSLTAYFVILRYADVESALQNRGLSLVRQLAPAAQYGTFSGNRSELLRLIQATTREPDVSGITIYDVGGRPLASAGNPIMPLEESPAQQGEDSAVDVFRATIPRPNLPFDDPFLAQPSVPVKIESNLGTVVLELSRSDLDTRKHEILWVTLLSTLAVLIAAALLARRLGRDITEPVLALADAVARVRAGHHDVRIPSHPSRTLESLESDFNEMAVVLDENNRRSANALAQSEAELARQLGFAQTLLDAQSEAGIGLMIVDHGQIVFANQAISTIFGYTLDELHALPSFLALVHPGDRRRVMHSHLRRLRGEVFANHYDFVFQRRDGQSGHGDLTVATLPAGDHLQILCMIVDITERKLAETRLADAHRELLQKKDEAEKASEGKSRFLAAASHDLRQPLHALTLFANELGTAGIASRERRLANQIVTAAGAMGELLDAMLDVSRLDVAALQVHRQPVALGPLLETIAESHRRSALAKGLRLRCRPSSLWVDTDPHLLRRMVGNLIANAVRYSYRGGVIIGARIRANQVRIEVWDSGVGIDDAHLPFLFQEFYQVGNPERDAGKGLGLGLSIVARLGQILDHPVEVRSRPGRGSVFIISLPRLPAGPYPAAETATGPTPKAKLVVFGSSAESSDAIYRLLASWGYPCEGTVGIERVADIVSRGPDLLICEAELLEEVSRVLGDIEHQPLMVVVGASEADIPPGLTVDGRLSRPVRPARLRALLHHLLIEESEPSVVRSNEVES